MAENLFAPFGKQLTLPSNLEGIKKHYLTSTVGILESKKPKRPPRFFYRSKFLVPYNSMKAKLQMSVDAKDIELGVSDLLGSR